VGSRARNLHDLRLRKVTSEIVARYEAEMEPLRARVKALEAEVVDGRRRKKVMEDELRRTLLKGMVHVNMEALNIFHNNAVDDTAHVPGYDV